ncbi:efflux RND transporter periplasmic adaptor subunit [Streptomyces sp. NPDC014894]|uniref:efflux RND transporter periplasmic adaptor subunit n=1 Tax=unclassified Streptomyces TaxID=2593676 RepID=UPI003700DD63
MSTELPETDGTAASSPEPRRPRKNRPKPHGPRRRGPLLIAAAVVLVAAAATAVVVTDPLKGEPAAPAGAGERTGAVATVREGPLSAQINQVGTLSYAARPDGSAYTVVNQTRGIYTSLPAVGDVVKCGQTLYAVADRPVPLLCGTRPFYRDLAYGDSGRDVKALNRNLLALGHATSSELDADSDDFGAETREALINLQDDVGAEETGRLKLGDAVLLPGPLRVTKTVAAPGTRAAPGAPVLEAGTTGRQVKVELNASQQTGVSVGDPVRVTLPDNRTAPGKVSRIGTIAGSAGGKEEATASGASTALLPVYITLKNPKDAGSLDQAPVQVRITTAGVKKALTVPVTALVGVAGDGFAVERVDTAGKRHTVPVTLGLFDNAGGQVQITGELRAGDRVAVPAT